MAVLRGWDVPGAITFRLPRTAHHPFLPMIVFGGDIPGVIPEVILLMVVLFGGGIPAVILLMDCPVRRHPRSHPPSHDRPSRRSHP